MNSRKVKLTILSLVIGFVLLVSASYAWFTLSTKPEISGIQTNIGANGSLEIALLTPQTFMHPEEIKTSIGSSMVNQEVTYSNQFWGNIIDLADESYGLGQVSLLPSRLDISALSGEQTVVSGNLLKVPGYGVDGRFSYFDTHVVSASYDPPYFRYSSDVSFRGVRGIGTISRVTVQQAALNNARTSISSYESAARRSMESIWRANGDPLFDILYRLHGKGEQSFTSADVAVILDTCSRMLGVMDYLDAATRQGIVAIFAEVVWDESQFLAIKSMVENPTNSLSDLEDMLDDYSYSQYAFGQTISQLIKYVPQDQKTLQNIMTRCNELEGTAPTRNDIYELLHTRALLSVDYTFFNDYALNSMPSELSHDNRLTLYSYDMAPSYGVMNHVAAYVGSYSVFFEYSEDTSMEVSGNAYNNQPYLESLSSELSGLSGSGMIQEETAVLDMTYGYAIDLAVRCNIDSDLLLQTVAADRIDPDASSDPEDILSQTQGGGSYMRFTRSLFKDQMIPLMDAIRIGFLDNRNNLIAVAKLNTSNYTEEGDELTAPLYLYDYTVAEDGSLSMGERRKENNRILSLPEDSAVVMTVVVWLDGDHVPNSLVSTLGRSIDGTLNLQFASSAELNPAFKDDPDATQPDETKPVEPSDVYYLSADNGQYAFYTLGADGTRNYTLPFSGTVDEENHTVTVDSVSEYPDQGIWIPALATGDDGAAYSVSIDPSAPFENLSADAVHISFVPVNGSKVGVTDTSLQDLFDTTDRSVYRTIDVQGLNTTGVTSMYELFRYCSGLTELDVSGLDTSNVTDMDYMFCDCSGLTELDLSDFDTTKLTDMGGMFAGCTSLVSLDISGFTPKLSNAYEMFSNCSNLTALDLNGFDTTNVTNMALMFANCSSLTKLDLTSFDTANVTSMRSMFDGCSGLTELDLGNFDTSNVKNMGYTFNDCQQLKRLNVSNLDTSSVTNMLRMFGYCKNLTGLDLSSFDTSSVTSMGGMFYNCADLTELDLSGFDTSDVISMEDMFGDCSKLAALDLSNFDTSNVINMAMMFRNCTSLTKLNISSFDTGNVTDMNYMFQNCSGLTELDVSGFDTSKVTDMSSMFYYCSGLTELDVSGFDTGNATAMRAMFNGCSGLTELDVSGFDTGNVTDMGYMFSVCSGLTELDVSSLDTSNVTDMDHMFGNCSGLTELNVSGFDTNNVTDMNGMFFDCSSLTELDVGGFDTANVTNMGFMFRGCAGLTELDLSSFSTSNVKDMSAMFLYCSGLTELDLNSFNTSAVTSMFLMFDGCSSLTELNVSGFDTSTVTDMGAMFESCSGLTELDVSGWDTAIVTDMDSMFDGCSGLRSLDVSGWDIGNVTEMSYVFRGCSGLRSLDVSGFDTTNVTDMSAMFSGCSGLTELDVSGFDTANVTSMEYMFSGCSGLTELDVSGFNTGNVTNMRAMFQSCASLTELDVSGWDTANVTDMSQMFRGCSGLTELDLSSFDASKVTNTANILYGCSNLQTIVTPKVIGNTTIKLPASYHCAANGNTYTVIDSSVPTQATLRKMTSTTADDGNVYYFSSEATNGAYVIYTLGEDGARDYQLPVTATLSQSDKTLTIAEVTEFPADGVVIPAIITDDTGTAYSVVLTGSPFYRPGTRTASLTFVAVNGQFVGLHETSTSALFATYSSTYVYEGFAYLDVSALDTSKVTNMSGTFSGCEELVSLNISQWDTSSVTDMSSMFDDCNKLTSIELSNFDTKNVTNMYAMFFDCSGLTELDLSNFDTSSVTNLRYVFYGCSGLTELDLSNFDTANVTSIAGLFGVCTGLTELDLSNFNTANVKDMSDVFSGCTNLQTINLTGWSYAKVTSTNGMFDNCPAKVIK